MIRRPQTVVWIDTDTLSVSFFEGAPPFFSWLYLWTQYNACYKMLSKWTSVVCTGKARQYLHFSSDSILFPPSPCLVPLFVRYFMVNNIGLRPWIMDILNHERVFTILTYVLKLSLPFCPCLLMISASGGYSCLVARKNMKNTKCMWCNYGFQCQSCPARKGKKRCQWLRVLKLLVNHNIVYLAFEETHFLPSVESWGSLYCAPKVSLWLSI